jgi:hypothetical protein
MGRVSIIERSVLKVLQVVRSQEFRSEPRILESAAERGRGGGLVVRRSTRISIYST